MPVTPQTAPTDQEQLLLELTNRARADPAGEFDALITNAAAGTAVQPNITSALSFFGVDLDAFRAQLAGLTSAAPLAWNGELATAARIHSQLMLDLNEQSHRLPGEASLGERITAAGYDWRGISENIFAFTDDMVQGHAGFYIDWGYDDSDFVNGSLRGDWQNNGDGIQDEAGHRVNILNPARTEIGIGVIAGTGERRADQSASASIVGPLLVTQNFGARFGYEAQLVGVVLDDRDGDRFYDLGEGMGAVTVTATGVAGTFTTQSWASGGYQMVLPSGEYTVRFEGGGLSGMVSHTVAMGAENVKLDAFNADALPAILTGTDAAERLEGGPRDERLNGLGGNDTLFGGDGTDTIDGGTGDDFIFGGATTADLRDVVYGGDGNDSIDGGHGNDELNGGAGNDTVLGGFGSDTVIGNAGDDLLTGGAGSDLMFGGPGNDLLNGGWGFDRMNGGTGADRFYHLGVADHASDWVQDYSAADGDLLVFGQASATRGQFQVNIANTPNAGAAQVAEAFVIYRPTGQIMWALVDGDGQSSINLQIGAQVFDLLA